MRQAESNESLQCELEASDSGYARSPTQSTEYAPSSRTCHVHVLFSIPPAHLDESTNEHLLEDSSQMKESETKTPPPSRSSSFESLPA